MRLSREQLNKIALYGSAFCTVWKFVETGYFPKVKENKRAPLNAVWNAAELLVVTTTVALPVAALAYDNLYPSAKEEVPLVEEAPAAEAPVAEARPAEAPANGDDKQQ